MLNISYQRLKEIFARYNTVLETAKSTEKSCGQRLVNKKKIAKIKEICAAHKLGKEACFHCGLEEWDVFHITEIGEVDHVDGNNNNNNIHNLRVLCPNCHTHTMTRSIFNKEKRLDTPGSKPIHQINMITCAEDAMFPKSFKERQQAQNLIPVVRPAKNKIPLDDVFKGKHTGFHHRVIGDRLIGEGFFAPICNNCKISVWRNIPMNFFLELHHIDYNARNNSQKNLELLCSNCHRAKHLKKEKLDS